MYDKLTVSNDENLAWIGLPFLVHFATKWHKFKIYVKLHCGPQATGCRLMIATHLTC
uniref:Uncharacterized protein n=1 Tax=Arundo donax TaxID=35708 RepID=A0A0A8Z749_ARUDO